MEDKFLRNLTQAIYSNKQKLIKRVKKHGLYENFGQAEILQIKDRFGYYGLIYGTPKQRNYASKINDFEAWVKNYSS